MRTISCITLDDEKHPRERLAILLGKMDNVKIWGIEECPEEATKKIIDKKPDLVFIDVEMPRMSGFDVVKEVRKEIPHQQFVFVTGYNQYAIKAIKEQAFDYILKPVDIDELKETINRYRKSSNSIYHTADPETIKILKSLSPRELEVLKLIRKHKTAQEIANILCLSKNTIDTHRKSLFKKTGFSKISELITFSLNLK